MATRRTSLTAYTGPLFSRSALLRVAALLLLVAQLGVVAHRIEHYIAPEHMECGEDACIAFAPTPDTVEPIEFVPPLLVVVFFLRFWTVHSVVPRAAGNRLGFRAHAPPV
jgi:hypothetical protein